MKLTKRILASVLATACAVSSLSLASLADEPEATVSEMKLGLNATFYQTKKIDHGDNALADKVCEINQWQIDNQNHGIIDSTTEYATIDDNDRLFNQSMQALEQCTSKVESGLTNITKISQLAYGPDLGIAEDRDNKGQSYWAHMTGDITLEAGTYQFAGKFDNGVVIDLTPKTDDAETEAQADVEPIRVLEFWGNGSWADWGLGVKDNEVEIAAGDYTIDVYFLEYWGGNLADVQVKKDDEDFVSFDDNYTIETPKTDVYAVTIDEFDGDYIQIDPNLVNGGGAQSANFDGKKQYDDTIEAIEGIVYEAGSIVVPSPTIVGGSFKPDAEAAGCNGDNSILVDYDGYITATKTGTYQFGLKQVDNGAVVTIGEDRVVEYWAKGAWVDQDAIPAFYDETAPTVELTAGVPVKFNVKYLEIDGGDRLQIYAREVIAPEEEGGDVTYGDGALIDENFIFTQTADMTDDEFEAAKASLDEVPTLEAVAAGDKVLFDGFKELSEDVENNDVVIDEETGIATFKGNGTNLVLPEYITKQINTSSKLVVEAVFKKTNDMDHGVVASVGTSTNENDDIQSALMGLREGWRVKTLGGNDACAGNVLRYNRWATVKWVFDENGSKIYVDGKEVVNLADKKVKLDKIQGQFHINNRSIVEWDNAGIEGQMAEFRITIDDYNPAEVTEIKVKDLPAVVDAEDATLYTVDIPVEEGDETTVTAEDIAVATLGSEATADTVAVNKVEVENDDADYQTFEITVTANDDETLTKTYTLKVVTHVISDDASITGLKVNGIDATLVEEDNAGEEPGENNGETGENNGETGENNGETGENNGETGENNGETVAQAEDENAGANEDTDTSIKYTASVYKATAYDVTVETKDKNATVGAVETVEEGKTYKVTVTAEDGETTQEYTVDITTDKVLGENGVIASMAPNGDGNWDDGEKELNEDGDLILNEGDSGDFWGGYWRDVRPTHAVLPQGVYKVVYLFDLAENSGSEMRLVPFIRWDGDRPDYRPNERMIDSDWAANAQGNKVAISFLFQTKADADDFEVNAWKGGNVVGTFDGVKICTADCDVATAFSDYKVIYEGAPATLGSAGNEIEVAAEGTYTASTVAKSANTAITGIKVNNLAATVDAEDATLYTVTVPEADEYVAVPTLVSAAATYETEDVTPEDAEGTKTIKVTVTAEDETTTQDYTVVVTTVDGSTMSSDTSITGVKVNGIDAVKAEDGKYTASVCKATKYDVTVATTDDKATYEVEDVTAEDAAEGTKSYKVTVTAENGDTKDYTVDITTDKALADEKGVIAEVKPSTDGTWDDNKARELDDNGNLVLKEGESGNFTQTNWKDIANNAILPQGVYKVVYLFDVAENSASTFRFVSFNKDGQDADYRPNENMTDAEWNALKGKKVAFVFVVKTKKDVDDFMFNAHKPKEVTGTFNGITICTADTNVCELYPDYTIGYEGNPKYHAKDYTEDAAANEFKASVINGGNNNGGNNNGGNNNGGNNNSNNSNNSNTNKPTTVAVSKVTLNKTKATVVLGKTLTLKATVAPTNATNKKVTWKSSNTKVATVNAAGKVTAKGFGTARITATAGGKTATCTITVKPGKVSKLAAKAKGKTLTITFKKGAKASATKLVIYRNNKKVKTVNTSKTKVTVKNLKAGKYTVKAYATKKVGKKTYTSDVVKTKKATKIK